jgi:TPR repeat protein
MEEAVQLYQQAAQAGDALGMSQLARLLEQGKGVAEDRLGALKLYRQAAAAGDAVALNGMGGFYERGDVVAQDLAEAARLYVQSAEGGDAFGAANAARCFQLGIGVKQSSKEAEQWARAAAEKGIRGETLQAETDAAEMANLPRPLLGGRPSRYSYIPVADSELVSQNATEVAEDALYDGAGQIEGQIVRFRRAESPVYFKSPNVLWEIPAAAAAESGGAAAA